MPLYQVDRCYGDMPDEELDGAGFRADQCTRYFPGLRWLRSYFDPVARRSVCLYEATSADDLRRHAALAALPCDRVVEVVEVLPDQFR
jgi:hypothetical protein